MSLYTTINKCHRNVVKVMTDHVACVEGYEYTNENIGTSENPFWKIYKILVDFHMVATLQSSTNSPTFPNILTDANHQRYTDSPTCTPE